MALELQHVLARAPAPWWRPMGLLLGVGLLLSGTSILRPVHPPRAEASKAEVVPLTLELGSRFELEVPGVVRVAVGTPDVVEVHVVEAETVRLEPLAPGTTELRVWMRNGTQRTYPVSVRAR
jgi:eukaryotic-like serine/threonine-protein kinase